MKRTPNPTRTGPPAAAGHSPGDALVQDCLDRLAQALTTGDTQAVATLWQTPALVLGEEDEHAVVSRQEVENFFSSAKAHYNARGVTDTRGDIQRLEWLTPRIALVEVRWPHLDAHGNELGEETSTYVLKRDPSGELKLRVAVMQGEATTH
jgi:hypothetical protein